MNPLTADHNIHEPTQMKLDRTSRFYACGVPMVKKRREVIGAEGGI
jgi:hypothetical protein